MMDKNEIKLLRAFLIETKTTQKEFAREAGICERTVRTAIKTGNVSNKTWNKILDTIIAETIQIQLIRPEEKSQVPAYMYKILRISYLLIGILATLMLLNSVFE